MRNPQTLCIPQRKPRADAIACYGRHGHKAPFGIGYPDLVCGKQLPRTEHARFPTQGQTSNADGIDAIIRQRVKIGMIGKALNLDGVEDMSISAAKKAIIKAVRPEMRLDGKSDAFVNAAFEYAVADVESRSKKDVGYQKKQMFNRDSRTPVSNGVGSADSARQKMIERRQNRAKEEK